MGSRRTGGDAGRTCRVVGCNWPSAWAHCTTVGSRSRPTRAARCGREKLDEGLAIYDGLMRGQPYSFSGKHYQVRPTDFAPPPMPVQRPRVPVWVVGAYPSAPSLRRAARWDGLLSTKVGFAVDTPFGPSDLADVAGAVRTLREDMGLPWEGYDVVAEGVSEPGAAGDARVREWAAAGRELVGGVRLVGR